MPYANRVKQDLRDIFLSKLATPMISERLFSQIPDIVYCVKNLEGRYVTVNRAFSDRLGLKSPNDIIGKTAHEIFPSYLADIYSEQDQQVFSTGEEIVDRLELVSNYGHGIGWYLASKFPLRGSEGEVIGLASISRDLQTPGDQDLEFAGLLKVVTHIHKNFDSDIKPGELAEKIGLTTTQLDRRMRKIFKLTTSQFIRKTRLESATRLLTTTNEAIVDVALKCGYGDQSAFTRQFKATVGMTPGAYREKYTGEL